MYFWSITLNFKLHQDAHFRISLYFINLFRVNNKITRITSLTLFWCHYRQLWVNFTHCSGVSITNFEHVNAAGLKTKRINKIDPNLLKMNQTLPKGCSSQTKTNMNKTEPISITKKADIDANLPKLSQIL